mmetsp:Transcript_28785/g.25972  ORF Transcript_28785/g.25972 Transcript_28785/m.25972 type:complete len:227 (-) Transcript_28785:189-869(-)
MNAIQGTIRYNIGVDEFFDQNGPNSFVSKVALVLGIDTSRIRIAEIKEGSTIVIFAVDALNQPEVDASAEELAAVDAELAELLEALTKAADDGSLIILDAEIIDSSFVVAKKNYETEDTSETSRAMIFIIVACVIAGLALIIGTIIVCKKYKSHKKKVQPSKIKNYALSKNVDLSGFTENQQSDFIGNNTSQVNEESGNATGMHEIVNISQSNNIKHPNMVQQSAD